MDRIIIRDLALRCIIGVNEQERREKQDVVINVVIEADLSGPAKTDNFDDTVDYRSIKKEICALVEVSQRNLIEALAGDVAALCLRHRGVERVTVTVDKPGALRFARSVAVEITRERGA